VIDGYKHIEYRNCTDQIGGGVGLYVKDTFMSTRKKDLEIDGLEAMWHELKIQNETLLLCVCYRPPNSGLEFWDKLGDSLDLAKVSNSKNILLTGYLNSDPGTSHGKKLSHFAEANNLFINVHQPTRKTAQQFHTGPNLD